MYSQAGNKETGFNKCCSVSQEADATIWHQRLCHVPMKVLKRIPMFQHLSKNSSFTLNNVRYVHLQGKLECLFHIV